ncbi:MAG: molybdenum cofactor guanylyltransferase [Kangiellaceae bacterium]|nr:molybdenum cofactor guanylyltransferase [Kangiellaceae bacterium]
MTNQFDKLTLNQITGLVLAGGRGSRLGEIDKGFLDFEGQSLIKRQLTWLTPQVSSVLISANQNISEYENFGYRVLTDDIDEFLGPLQGIYQGLVTCKSEWLYVQPVDVPSLPKNTISMFINRVNNLDDSKKSGIYFLETEVRKHYLSMLIAKAELDNLRKFLAQRKNKVRDFLKLRRAACVNIGFNESCFKNINRPSDL